ncbi:hypothetical protein [Chromobacterium sphagni]|uniref:hypothetical protein n=1 Tax=Chromobacterium sphagni TaxID=1903179 RepID=UPI001300E1FF|nr:hypothetical protein [Chromobacterium sphagni]
MYKIPKQSYITEFKQETVRLIETKGRSPAHVDRDLGIAEQIQQLAQGQQGR